MTADPTSWWRRTRRCQATSQKGPSAFEMDPGPETSGYARVLLPICGLETAAVREADPAERQRSVQGERCLGSDQGRPQSWQTGRRVWCPSQQIHAWKKALLDGAALLLNPPSGLSHRWGSSHYTWWLGVRQDETHFSFHVALRWGANGVQT